MKHKISKGLMYQKHKLKIYLVFSILAVVAAVWCYVKLEKVQESIDIGMSPEARQKSKLAAMEFLVQSGISAEGQANFAKINHLPPNDHILIITGQRYALSRFQYQKISEWVSSGGQLIVTAQTLWDEDKQNSGDYFLDQLGVRQYLTKKRKKDQTSSGKTIRKKVSIPEAIKKTISANQISQCPENLDPSQLSQAYFGRDSEPLVAKFSTDFKIIDASKKAIVAARSQYGIHMLQYAIGKGLVTVLTDDWIWDNQHIQCFDHAYLLWQLTKGSQKVWFLYRSETPGVFLLLILNNHILIISTLLLILLFILKYSTRFGPVIKFEVFDRRHIKEHIDASGMFCWKKNSGEVMIENLRNQIEQQLLMFHKDAAVFSENGKYRYLAQKCLLSENKIEEALTRSGVLTEKEFTHLVKNLQILRKSI